MWERWLWIIVRFSASAGSLTVTSMAPPSGRSRKWWVVRPADSCRRPRICARGRTPPWPGRTGKQTRARLSRCQVSRWLLLFERGELRVKSVETPGTQGCQEVSRFAAGRRLEPAIPVLEEASQVGAQPSHHLQALFHEPKLHPRQIADLQARMAAPRADAELSGQLRKSEPDRKRAADDPDGRHNLQRVDPVAVRTPRRHRNQPQALIVPEGVGADSSPTSRLSRPEESLASAHGRILHPGIGSRVKWASPQPGVQTPDLADGRAHQAVVVWHT